MNHAVSLLDLQSRGSGTADLRIFTGHGTRTVQVEYEQHHAHGHTYHEFMINGTDYEQVYSWDALKDFMILGYDSDGWTGFIVPIWDEPDVDPAVVNGIVAEMRKTINFLDLAEAIPYEDRMDMAANYFNPTVVAAICLAAGRFDVSVMYEFIKDQLAGFGAQQDKMMQSIDSMLGQFGITGVKFV